MLLESKASKIIGALIAIVFIVFMNYKIRIKCEDNGGEVIKTKEGLVCLKKNSLLD